MTSKCEAFRQAAPTLARIWARLERPDVVDVADTPGASLPAPGRVSAASTAPDPAPVTHPPVGSGATSLTGP